MKNFKLFYLSIILFLLCFIKLPCLQSTESGKNYTIKDGKIIKINNVIEDTLKTGGFVEKIYYSGNELYYISRIKNNSEDLTGENVNKFLVGIIGINDGKNIIEIQLPYDFTNVEIKRFSASKGSIYFLDNFNTLYRIGMNRKEFVKRQNIVDFALIKEKLVLIEKDDDDDYKLNFNGSRIPLSLNKPDSIKEIINNRLILVSNQQESELIDIVQLKSLYQYSKKREFKLPGKYNLIINIIDDPVKLKKSEFKKVVFYKIFIDGNDKGRTETGPAAVKKIFNIKQNSNEYYIIELERWELDYKKNRYSRSNNIYQPHAMRIYLPANRILKLNIKYNGFKYIISRSNVLR